MTPLLSVTVLNYNYAHYLPESLNSILAQTLTDFELILINDCSTDNSREIIEPYLVDPRIRLVDHETNRGYVESLLEGCRLSRGKYLTVISADDYALTPDAFALAIGAMEQADDISLCFASWREVDDQSNVRHTRRAAPEDYVHDGVVELRRMAMSSDVLHSGAMLRRTAYDTVGGYDRDCRYSVDTNMWLALCTAGRVAYLSTPLFAYRAHNTNLSNSGGALWQATSEMLLGIDRALARVPDADLPDKSALRRAARARALVAVPTLDIFAGRRQRGWKGFGIAFRHHPAETLLQRRFVSLLLCSLLGASAYTVATGIARRRKGDGEGDHPTHA